MDVSARRFRLGANASQIQASVRRRGIEPLRHLGRVDQLRSIFTFGGLLSRAKMDEEGIAYRMSGWGAEGKAEEMKDYICCSLRPPWGMSWQYPDSKVLILLQRCLLWREGTLFSPTWSSHNSVTLQLLLKNNTAEVFDSMFANRTSSFPSPAPGEILIPHSIELTYFVPQMYFHSENSKASALDSLEGVSLPDGRAVSEAFRFEVSPYQFRGNY